MTAVEWLVEQMPTAFKNLTINKQIIEQAKAIEKEQKIKDMIGLLQWMNKIALETPMRLETDLDDIVEQYYNETYGSNTQI
jgi:hypothetical protein